MRIYTRGRHDVDTDPKWRIGDVRRSNSCGESALFAVMDPSGRGPREARTDVPCGVPCLYTPAGFPETNTVSIDLAWPQ